MEKAIIGGTGVYGVSNKGYSKTINTRYGDAYMDVVEIEDEEIVFLARHGKGHSVPPHLINYRANMKALEMLGVKYIYSTAAVGSCNEKYAPGDIVVINDFLDFTKARSMTFYEGGEDGVVHTDMSEPYCRNLRAEFYKAANELAIDVKGEGVYVCTEGPRFETKQEIRMYKSLGGDVVGMTNVPEVVLAKELGMCYATIGIVTNWCTGIGSDDIAGHQIREAMEKNKENITNVIIKVFSGRLDQKSCKCRNCRLGM